MAPRRSQPKEKPAKAPKTRAKKPPKAAPVSVTKHAEELTGPRPLSPFDFEFCKIFCETGKQVEAWRQLRPEDKDPHKAAHRMMQRPEIREHIKEIFRIASRDRQRAAEVTARSLNLTLEVADDRLLELVTTRRRTRAEMLTRDTKMLLVEGAVPSFDENGGMTMKLSPELSKAIQEEAAPIEDADLLKGIKLVYERKRGIVRNDKEVVAGPVNVMLYRPKWFGAAPAAPAIEASANG